MLRLNVGTNRKIGQPDYGSAGASCNLELELDTTLFQDLDGLQQVVRRAYAACNQAVNDELARLTHHGQHQHQHHEVSQPGISPEPVVEISVLPASLQFLNRDSPGDESRLRGRSGCRRWAVQRARGGHVESAGGCTIASITIVPGHPLPWSGGDGSSMPLQRG